MAITVLGIPVPADLVSRWRTWFAPELQPIRTDLLPPDVVAVLPVRAVEPTLEWTDTFFLYTGTWTWLTEAEFLELRPSHRRSLLAARRRMVHPKRIPVWPSELARSGDGPLFDWVASGAVRTSRHRDVPAGVWRRATAVLPGARTLAATFATSGSGPNCFGTVMAAAGQPELTEVQIGPDRLQGWLEQHADPVSGTGSDDEPGIVFTWTEYGKLAHATVTLGSGWMLTKPSQAWSSPRLVYTVREAVDAWRLPGVRLARYRLRR